MSRQTDLILQALDQAHEKVLARPQPQGCPPGPHLRGGGPAPWAGRPSIHEGVVPLAYWEYAVLRLLADLPRGTFPLAASNRFPRAAADVRQWKADLARPDRMQRELRAGVAALEPENLDRPSARAADRIRDLLLGVAALRGAGGIQSLVMMNRGPISKMWW